MPKGFHQLPQQGPWNSETITSLNTVLASPILQGNIIKDVEIADNTTVVVQHKLGRKLIGWIVIKKKYSGGTPLSDIWYDKQGEHNKTDTELHVYQNNDGSATATVDILVF